MRSAQRPIVTRRRRPSNADISFGSHHHSSLTRSIRKITWHFS